METIDCLRGRDWSWRVDRPCSVHSDGELYSNAAKEGFDHTVKTEVVGAERIRLPQCSEKTPMQEGYYVEGAVVPCTPRMASCAKKP